jgi:glycosyltransferase involved in cell wall biosynthesis
MITAALLPRADLVTAVGPHVLEDLILQYPRVAGKTAVLPPVGPEPAEVLSAKAEVPDHPWFRGTQRPLTVTCVANLVERKGQATLVDALPLLRSALGDVRLVLVGREDDETFAQHLRSAARAAGVEQHVWWAGYVRDPLPIIAHSNVFALASHSEGCPTVILEAMACGIPVVSSDCPAEPRYLLDEGRAGVLVPVGDAAAVAAAIVRLASDGAVRAEFVRRGLEQVAVFEPRKVARLYAQAAERVCDSHADDRRTVRLA